MSTAETKKGDVFILSEAVLWSLFPIITILSYSNLELIVSLMWSTLFAAIFFACMMVAKKRVGELRNPNIWKDIALVVLFIGVLFYGLYYTGLKFTTAGNAGIIATMELFFSYLFFNIWKKQSFSLVHTIGALLMLGGAFIILFPKEGLNFHRGDVLILLAAAAPPIGNYYQQKLRLSLSSETILFLRSILVLPIYILLAWGLGLVANWRPAGNSIWLLLVNGMIVLGLSKIFWLEGIHRISVTKAAALGSVTPAFTILFAYFILHQQPRVWQLAALPPIIVGVILLTAVRSRAPAVQPAQA